MTRLTTPHTGNSPAPGSAKHASMATGAVAIFAGPIPDQGRIKHVLAQNFPPANDTFAQVHRASLPLPGDESELFRAIAFAPERPLDPDRPPWACRIIEGLQNHRWAILITLGQGVAEGLSAAQLLARLCDDDAGDSFANSDAPEHLSPSRANTPSWSDIVWQASARAVTSALRLWPAGGPPSTMRRYRTVIAPRVTVDHIAAKLGVTADDIALAAITEGFRTVILQRGEPPRADTVHVLGSALPYLPVQHQDPVAQLRAVRAPSSHSYPRFAVPARFTLCAKAIQSIVRPPQHVVTLATTPPGPRFRLRLMGQQIDRMLPISPSAAGTGIAVLSYGDELVFGITTDAALDIDLLAAGIERGVRRLVALGQDSVVLFDRRRKRSNRAPANGAARWRPSSSTVRVRH